MGSCEQTSGLSVLQHGYSVHSSFRKILNGDIQLPVTGPQFQWLLTNQLPLEILAEYQIHHDCGKPFCLIVDEDGKRHFPGHAALSERLWREAGGDTTAARLMGQDMDFHLLSADDCLEFIQRPDAASLILTAWAEIHANAEMFGGQDSTSFKIKSKHLERRTRTCFRILGIH